jgi:hypothetical protein
MRAYFGRLYVNVGVRRITGFRAPVCSVAIQYKTNPHFRTIRS